ncbi:MAG: chemotaxis protein CheW [Planctomycetota bacterium]
MSTEILETPTLAGSEDRHLCFVLDGGQFAVQILQVREIIAMHPITPLPGLGAEVRGVINLRGKIIPVLDLRIMLGLHAKEQDRNTCIVVFDASFPDGGTAHIGCIVDSVREVVLLPAEAIQAAPSPKVGGSAAFILGLAKPHPQEPPVSILDIDYLVSDVLEQPDMAMFSMDEDSDDSE